MEDTTKSNNVVNGDNYETSHPLNLRKSKANVVLGAQWGDEGKGKVVDMLASEADIVCRCQVSKRVKEMRKFFCIPQKN